MLKVWWYKICLNSTPIFNFLLTRAEKTSRKPNNQILINQLFAVIMVILYVACVIIYVMFVIFLLYLFIVCYVFYLCHFCYIICYIYYSICYVCYIISYVCFNMCYIRYIIYIMLYHSSTRSYQKFTGSILRTDAGLPAKVAQQLVA